MRVNGLTPVPRAAIAAVTPRPIAAPRMQRGDTPSAPDWVAPRVLLPAGPPPSTPYTRYVADVRARLAAAGLPDCAPGGRVIVLKEFGNDHHSNAIVRNVVGPLGLARGADVVIVPPEFSTGSLLSSAEWALWHKRSAAGDLTLADVVRLQLTLTADVLAVYRRALAKGRAFAANATRGGTTIASLSAGVTIAGLANTLTHALQNGTGVFPTLAPAGSVLRRDLEARLGAFPPPERTKLLALLATLLRQELGDTPTGKYFAACRGAYAQDVENARREGLLLFDSAGNDFQVASSYGRPEDSLDLLDTHAIIVGATSLDEQPAGFTQRVANFSSGDERRRTVTIAAPGDNLPIGDNGALVSGTSFAAPFAAAVAALMLAANPTLSPDEIEAILTDPGVAQDLPGTLRDGAGALDPVRAVARARSYVRPSVATS